MKKIRRTDEDVIACGKLIADGYTVTQIENNMGIPHSTAHWIVRNRLVNLDQELWERCLSIFMLHKCKKGLRDDWTV